MSDRSITLYVVTKAPYVHTVTTDDGEELLGIIGDADAEVLTALHEFLTVMFEGAVKLVADTITVTSVGGVVCTRVTDDCDDPILRAVARLIRGRRAN